MSQNQKRKIKNPLKDLWWNVIAELPFGKFVDVELEFDSTLASQF